MADLEPENGHNPDQSDHQMEDQTIPNPTKDPAPVETVKKYEYIIKLRFNPKTGQPTDDHKQLNTHLATHMTQVLTEVSKEVRFSDKHGAELFLMELHMDNTKIDERINYDRANGNRQLHLLITMETTLTWRELKSQLFPWLKNQHLFMDRHFFGQKEIRVSKLGFLSNLHPLQTHRQTLQSKINSAFVDEYDNMHHPSRTQSFLSPYGTTYPGTRNPHLRPPTVVDYVQQENGNPSPCYRMPSKRQSSSHPYTDSSILRRRCLQPIFPFGLPYDVSRKNAEAEEYITVLQRQNLYLRTYIGIQIAGLHTADLDHVFNDNLSLRQKMLRHQGIAGLEPAAATGRIGKWNVQTTKSDSAATSQFLDHELPTLIEQIPNRPAYFPHYTLPRRLQMSWTSQEYLNDMTTSAATSTKSATIDLTTTPSAWKSGPAKNIAVATSSKPSTTSATMTNTHLDTHIKETTSTLEQLKTTIQAMQSYHRSEFNKLRTNLATTVTTMESVAKDITKSRLAHLHSTRNPEHPPCYYPNPDPTGPSSIFTTHGPLSTPQDRPYILGPTRTWTHVTSNTPNHLKDHTSRILAITQPQPATLPHRRAVAYPRTVTSTQPIQKTPGHGIRPSVPIFSTHIQRPHVRR